MGAAFHAERWLDEWAVVGGVLVTAAGVSLVLSLDGNQAAQQSLMSKLDAFRGRRAEVRDAALERWRSV